MKLYGDTLRLIIALLPLSQIYSLLLELGDFTNEWFWQAKLIQDYPHAPLEQGLKFTHTYAKLYQKYHQFWRGKKVKLIGAKSSSHKDVYHVSSHFIDQDTMLPPYTSIISGELTDRKLYVYLTDMWVRIKRIKLIEKYPLDLYQISTQFNGFNYTEVNLAPYLDQIEQNRNSRNFDELGVGMIHFSSFVDWRGVKYAIAYASFLGSVKQISDWVIINDDRDYSDHGGWAQIRIIK